MSSVLNIIQQIQTTRTQQSASSKDEVSVMRAMLNDTTYQVGIYGNNGVVGTYCPSEEARCMLAEQIHKTTKMPLQESTQLANEYEFGRHDAEVQVGLAKEFVNTYMETGRKLPLGVRATSDVSLLRKEIQACDRTYPKKVGINEDGTDRYEKATTPVPAHTSIRVISSCPNHLNGKN